MRLEAALRGSLKEMMTAELARAERAVTAGVREATDGLKTELRRQITSAGLGTRLANTWRGEVYPKGQPSIGAAGYVWSKAPGLVRLYAEGAVIRSKQGLFLAIPTPAAGRFGDARQKITPGAWERIHGLRLQVRLSPGQPEPARRRQRPADEAGTRGGEHRPAAGRCVHAACRAHHRAAVHPGAAGDGAEAPRRRRRGAEVDRGAAAAGRAALAKRSVGPLSSVRWPTMPSGRGS